MAGCRSGLVPVLAALTVVGFGGAALAAELQGSEWKPLRIDDIAVPEDSSAFIQFHSRGRLVGFSGCNRLFAEYEVGEGQILIGPVGATREACADSVMTRESALAAALENARSYQRMESQLVLFDHTGKPILEMRQTDWD